MGAVHAKEMSHKSSHHDPMEDEEADIDLKRVPAFVEKIHVDGLGRTKDDIVSQQLKPILLATNFQQVVAKSQRAKVQMQRLGLFNDIDIHIDISRGEKARSDGYEVTFRVKERRRVTGEVGTQVGTNEGSIRFGVRLPNILGRGESLDAQYTYGTKSSMGSSALFSKPLKGNPDLRVLASVYQNNGEYPWSGYKELNRGTIAEIQFPTSIGHHSLLWEGVWRVLECMSNTSAFAVREQSGHSLKSALRHTFSRDSRNDSVLPSNGNLFKASQELAGLGGDTNFIKHEMEVQLNQSLPLDTVFQVCLAGGLMRPLLPGSSVKINDRFMLGGPLTLRGFNIKGVGLQEDGCAMGGDMYLCGGLHLYTPLPFRPGKGGFGDFFRTHLFVNGGNLSNLNNGAPLNDNLKNLVQTLRWSYGAGIVMKIGGFARMELNYCWPMGVQKGDSVNPGLQFGIGVSFL
ncbi:hypothetical protein CAPTEDRAFT_156414 [Capitella teleta]|uniref:Bacterial surface antigen (D15) domain-containing protein n=1 Tax=Capitella teleta TaxID=283909 RepID=R7T871_CAPTE|nr:hypothetical protein CAPTEDRAFT_156414 [Capitella teleta]|eukprot:ELT89869.1 hypothetical protein CAPTEDRAFT_156414 [Capitella teleta]